MHQPQPQHSLATLPKKPQPPWPQIKNYAQHSKIGGPIPIHYMEPLVEHE